jgi:hypothetical protein
MSEMPEPDKAITPIGRTASIWSDPGLATLVTLLRFRGIGADPVG